VNKTKVYFVDHRIQFVALLLSIIVGGLLVGHRLGPKLESIAVNRAGVDAALSVNRWLVSALDEPGSLEHFGHQGKSAQWELQSPAMMQLQSLVYWDHNYRRHVIEEHPAHALQAGVLSGQHPGWSRMISARLVTLDEQAFVYVNSPVHSRLSGLVIGMAEFSFFDGGLAASIQAAKTRLWLLIIAITAGLIAILYWTKNVIERRIDSANKILAERDLHVMQIRSRLENIKRQYRADADQMLTSASSDVLHGTKLDIETAVDRLSEYYQLARDEPGRSDVAVINEALQESIRELKEITTGRSAPELKNLSIHGILDKVIQRHKRRTGVKVSVTISGLPSDISHHIKVCIYRFLQETLFNSYHHGKSNAVSVSAVADRGALVVSVRDGGCGFDPAEVRRTTSRLGMAGLRQRIGRAGGDIDFDSTIGLGTTVTMRFSLKSHIKPAVAADYKEPCISLCHASAQP